MSCSEHLSGSLPAASPAPCAPAAALRIDFPESLPVSGQRAQIMAALAREQVIIVCGETGSGKTTQLPKIALALGRGAGAGQLGADGRRGRLIGHTQPRRIAASSVARRIAAELDSPLGEVVGFKVRFQDRLARGARVKLMTDGILLAETQSDPLLQAYDTLIDLQQALTGAAPGSPGPLQGLPGPSTPPNNANPEPQGH